WPTLATGVPVTRHGSYAHRQLVPGTYREADVDAPAAEAPPFWWALAAAGLRVAVIDVPRNRWQADFPGLHVANWYCHEPDPGGFRVTDPAIARMLLDRFGPD